MSKTDANARLIAAAPDLKIALQRIRDLTVMVDSKDPTVVMRAATEFVRETYRIASEAIKKTEVP